MDEFGNYQAYLALRHPESRPFESAADHLDEMPPAGLRLYVSPYCGYCTRVVVAADEIGTRLQIVNVRRDRRALERLVRGTGRSQVPALGIFDADGERFLLESRDIIAYLEQTAVRSDE